MIYTIYLLLAALIVVAAIANSFAIKVARLKRELMDQKKLQHHYDSTIGLYAFDQSLDDMFELFEPKTTSEAYLIERINYLKSIVFRLE